MASSAADIVRELTQLGSKEKARASARFFRTGKGEYGYGDVFLGVTVPQQRVVARRHASLGLKAIETLLLRKEHECRLTALLILAEQFRRGSKKQRGDIVRTYLKLRRRVNNWDLVDSSAPAILGAHLADRNRGVLIKLAKSRGLWDRRIAIVATQAFIRRGDLADTFRIAAILLHDRHDLIHKAVGWMLREAGKRDLAAERAFLDAHGDVMPRTMLRYAIERFPVPLRKRYAALGSQR